MGSSHARDNGPTLTRTYREWVGNVATAFLAGAVLVGFFAGIYIGVRHGLDSIGLYHIPELDVFHAAVFAACVGGFVALVAAILLRPRGRLGGSGAGIGRSAGHVRVWGEPAAPGDDGPGLGHRDEGLTR